MARHLTALAAVVLIALPGPAGAQALDIGGIAIRLGEDVPEALKALSTYNVRYHDSVKSWFVSQEAGDDTEWLGNLSARNGKVSFISRGYALPKTGEINRVYTQALRDARRHGGQSCETVPVEFTDDLIHQIDTRCGR